MKFASQLVSVGVLLASVTIATAKPGYVLTTVNLRAAPGTGAEIVTKIPGGSLIESKGCEQGWCEVSWQEKTGYAIQTALDLSGHVPVVTPNSAAQAPRVRTAAPLQSYRPRGFVVDEPIYYDPPPAVVYYDRPYWPRRYWRRWWW
jgi:uncharacterized protein YraI